MPPRMPNIDEARAVLFAERFEDALDIAKRVAEDEIVAPAQVGLLPVMLPRAVVILEREYAEIHRSHVERAHLRLGEQRRGEPLLEGHMDASAGREMLTTASVACLMRAGIACRRRDWALAGRRIAGIQVQNGGARLRGLDSLRRFHRA
jgi:hypothetical protein